MVEGLRMIERIATGVALALALLAGPAAAKELTFTAALSGDKAPTVTGSKATGQAMIRVDTDKQTVGVDLDVRGLTIEKLSTGLRGAPMGPIHLHIYGSHSHGANDDAALVFPLPFGATYAPTATGFKVAAPGVPYATGAKLVNTKATFDEFVASLQSGRIVMNIHTNVQPDGEISGDVVPAQS
jgi:hypothetical protein